MKRPVKTSDFGIITNGKVMWTDGRRRIDLKSPIKSLLNEVEKENTLISYGMELHFNSFKLHKRIEELIETGVTPVLFYFFQEKDGDIKC